MEIRPATRDDREQIRAVARETWHDTYDELDDETIDETIDEWYGDEALETALSKPVPPFLVAEADGDLVGFTHGVVTAEEGDVLRCLSTRHQGEGIGTALYERLREGPAGLQHETNARDRPRLEQERPGVLRDPRVRTDRRGRGRNRRRAATEVVYTLEL